VKASDPASVIFAEDSSSLIAKVKMAEVSHMEEGGEIIEVNKAKLLEILKKIEELNALAASIKK
jgi:hypothetical protein